MIGALVWKQYRELRPAWVGITSIGCILLVGLSQWLDPGSATAPQGNVAEYLLVAGLLLSWCYGMVSGALLLAGEQEDATLAFLDILPASRRRVWLGKVTAGLLMLPAQAGVLLVLLTIMRAITTPAGMATAFAGLTATGLVGLGWGLASSARSPTVLGAIGRAAGLQLLAVASLALLVLLGWIVLGLPARTLGLMMQAGMPLGLALLATVAAATSARTFGAVDRQRRETVQPGDRVMGLGALLWLSCKQARQWVPKIAVYALLGGLAVAVRPVFGWPIVTLLVGVMCGLQAFPHDDPVRHLLAEQRLPMRSIWWARFLAVSAAAVAACGLVLLPCLALLVPRLINLNRSAAPLPPDMDPFLRLFGRGLVFDDGLLPAPTMADIYLGVWVIYGVAAGFLASLLSRSVVLTQAVAVLIAVVGLALWIRGPVQWWQVLGIPISLLLASRLLLPWWAAGQLTTRAACRRLLAAAGLAVLWTAAALWYRGGGIFFKWPRDLTF